MRILNILVGVMMFVSMSCFPQSAVLCAEAPNTPENFTQHVKLQPIITKIIEEDNVEEALQKLNNLHSEMSEDGWELFNLIEFIEDEDFEGFFVTYKKIKG